MAKVPGTDCKLTGAGAVLNGKMIPGTTHLAVFVFPELTSMFGSVIWPKHSPKGPAMIVQRAGTRPSLTGQGLAHSSGPNERVLPTALPLSYCQAPCTLAGLTSAKPPPTTCTYFRPWALKPDWGVVLPPPPHAADRAAHNKPTLSRTVLSLFMIFYFLL